MTSFRRTNIGLLLLMVFALLAFSCKKAVVAPPPQPAASIPTPPPPTPTITLRVEPATIQQGQSATLQWEARNAASVQIDPTIGQVAVTGNRQVNPTSSVTYNAVATGPGGRAMDTARITVNVAPPPPARPTALPRTTDSTIDQLFRQNVQEVYFDYDRADIRPDQVSKLQGNAAWLKEHTNVRFAIEGHCDDRGSEEYNLGLGDRRANAVREFLATQGLPATRMNTVSYGEERPVCRDESEQCFQKNRRAAFTMIP